jgi:SAM-dependent methyltransferase
MAATVATPRISGSLYFLGGNRACNTAPAINDEPNNTQCPCPKICSTNVGGRDEEESLKRDCECALQRKRRESFRCCAQTGLEKVSCLTPQSLDLGCGTGALTAEIAERGVEVLGVLCCSHCSKEVSISRQLSDSLAKRHRGKL